MVNAFLLKLVRRQECSFLLLLWKVFLKVQIKLTEMKNYSIWNEKWMARINIRLDIAEEKISESEGIVIETIQTEM